MRPPAKLDKLSGKNTLTRHNVSQSASAEESCVESGSRGQYASKAHEDFAPLTDPGVLYRLGQGGFTRPGLVPRNQADNNNNSEQVHYVNSYDGYVNRSTDISFRVLQLLPGRGDQVETLKSDENDGHNGHYRQNGILKGCR